MKKTSLRSRALTSLPFVTLLVGGCLASASDGQSTRDDEGSNFNAIGTSHVHVMPKSGLETRSLKNAASAAQLVYYGGPVISNIKVYTVFWGSSVNYTSQINQFYTAVTNSPYFDWLSEYNTTGQSPGTNQTIGRGSFLGTYNDTSAPTGTVDDSAIQSRLQTLISQGKIPGPSLDSSGNNTVLYAVHFAPGITITQGGQQSCVQFCAYHGTFQMGSNDIYYSVIPDQGGNCANGCGSSSSAVNNLTSVSSHEMIESVTDAAVGLATGTGAPLGWYDTTNGEIGDICNGQEGTVVGGDGKTYTVQLEWSNKEGACIATGPGGSGSSSSSSSSGTTSSSSSSSSGSSSSSSSSSSTSTSSSGSSSSSSSSSSTSTSSSGGTCSHPICSQGSHLTSTCDPCAKEICAQDPYCCNTLWDNVCVGEVGSICGESCSGGSSSSSSSSSSTSTSSSSSSSSSGGTTCSHSICTTGMHLKTTCDKCVLEICSQDSYCCTNKWDSVCVSEVGSICGETCN